MQGERYQQSMKASQYLLNNPSNNTSGINNCFQSPGLQCKSLNVKVHSTIDTETQLLRGVQSYGIIARSTISNQCTLIND